MNLLLVIYSGTDQQLVPALFEQHAVSGYTEMDGAHGHGRTGKREGTRAWPEDSAIYFSVVPTEQVDALVEAFRTAAEACEGDERLHVAVLPTQTFF